MVDARDGRGEEEEANAAAKAAAKQAALQQRGAAEIPEGLPAEYVFALMTANLDETSKKLQAFNGSI